MNPADPRFTDHAWAGQEIIDDTNAHAGHFTGLLVTAEATVSAMTWAQGYAVNATKTWANLGALPPGYYPGLFSSITLSGGRAIAIRRSRTP